MKHQGVTLVDRRFPSYKGWNEEMLKKRQAIEVYDGEFGVGSILIPLKEHLVKLKDQLERGKKVYYFKQHVTSTFYFQILILTFLTLIYQQEDKAKTHGWKNNEDWQEDNDFYYEDAEVPNVDVQDVQQTQEEIETETEKQNQVY